jgi:RNA polymerase sigma factor (sigma-70 family)
LNVSDSILDTRNSLLLRLPNKQDIDAWDQFVEIYQPLVFRLARSKGFQDADAHDIVQEVMIAVSKAIHRWDPDASKGRFRDWLFRIARNLMINFLTRRKYRPLAQEPNAGEWLEAHPDPQADATALSREFDWEYRRELYRIAAERVKEAVRSATWLAFQLSSVEQVPVTEVSKRLDMTEGAILVAKCRVIARLREEVKQLDMET